MLRSVRAAWARLRRRGRPADRSPGADHVPGRAHLVFEDGTIARADLGSGDQQRLEYLARRAVAPPPPAD